MARSSDNQPPLPPVVARAIAYVRDGLARGAWEANGRLPSIQSLARAAGVSLVTMWKAVRALRDTGELEVVHGKGVSIAGRSSGLEAPEFPVAVETERWRKVRQRIESDILHGRFGAGMALPTLKELSLAYGASFQTLKQALRALEIDGVVVPCGRTYAVAPVTARRSDAYVVVVGRGESVGDASAWTPWAQEWQRLLEGECARAGVGLESYLYTSRAGRLVFLAQDTGAEIPLTLRSDCLGVLIRSIGQDDLHLQVLQRLTDARLYVAVSDEGTCEPLPAPFSRNRRIGLFAVSNGLIAGRKVARFLIAKHHRRIAYISPYNSMRWSRDRLTGLQEVLATAGDDCRVSAYVLDDVPFPFGFRPEDHPGPDDIETWLTQWYRSHNRQASLRELAENLSGAFVQAAEMEELRGRLEPLFDRAAAERDVTAWVCGNDRVAVAALEFLRRRRDLQHITVVGFDDTFDAFRLRFSSYNFNIPALVHAMFTFVVAPHLRKTVRGISPVVNIEGYIVERSGQASRR